MRLMRCTPIASVADLRRVESEPYARFMPHGSIQAALSAVADAHGERPALSYIERADTEWPVRRWTHRALLAEVRRAANLFRRLGGHSPRVAMLLPAIPQAYFTLLGAETAGIVCPINYLLGDANIAELLRASGANVLVALGPHLELDIWSKVTSLRRECPQLAHVLAVGGAPDALDFDEALRNSEGDILSFERDVGSHTIAALFHTGGTTGTPKLAQHTHGNQLHASWGAAQLYAMTPDDVILNGFPLFHVAGSFVYGLSALLSGAEVVLPTLLGMRNPAFVSRYWEAVERHGVTLLAAVPTIMATLMGLDPSPAKRDSVRALYTGGSPLPSELATSFEQRYGIPVRNILGMTECAGVISIEPFLAPRVPGSCGLPLPFSEVTTADHVVRVRGPNVGPGYTEEKRNAGTFDGDLWLITGDIGHVDDEGRVFVTGRAKDVIIRSGHNIEPGVIEDALMRHPDVQFAAAVGEPDEYAGEMPVAFVALRPGATLAADALLDFIRPHIPERPAIPKRVDVLSALPMTAIGKVYKPALRLRAMERAITERLAARELGHTVRVEGRDTKAGAFLALHCASGSRNTALDEQVKATLAPFAIAWAWADADGASAHAS